MPAVPSNSIPSRPFAISLPIAPDLMDQAIAVRHVESPSSQSAFVAVHELPVFNYLLVLRAHEVEGRRGVFGARAANRKTVEILEPEEGTSGKRARQDRNRCDSKKLSKKYRNIQTLAMPGPQVTSLATRRNFGNSR